MQPSQTSSSAEVGDAFQALDHTGDSAQSSVPPPSQTRERSTVSKVVTKPVSTQELEDPREYQIGQVVRRFSPFRADFEEATTLKLRLSPTDPDFPFELESGLHCVLTVPLDYPLNGKPTLSVQNPEMVRGFQINVEKGFDSLVSQYPGKSLLALLNELDRNLERFLTSAKAPIVKIVANVRKDEQTQQAVAEKATDYAPFVPVFSRYSDAQLREARIRRDAEIRQLEARLGRSEIFSKADDGVAFNVPLQVPASANIPASLRSVREAALIIPEVYPLEPPSIILKGVEGRDAETIEVAFEKRVVQNSSFTLMAHINYLIQNLGKMAVDPNPKPTTPIVTDDEADEAGESASKQTQTKNQNRPGEVQDPSRPHLKYIARPPEWDTRGQDEEESETDSSDYDTEEESDSDVASTIGGASLPISSVSAVEKGIMISFPGLDLLGIGVLQITSLSISVKCDRCKEQTDIKNIKPSDAASNVHRTEVCSKCSATFSITYRSEMMHVNSSKAGYVELENCSITDMLPSSFQPTCSECSALFPSPPGVTAVRGDTSLTICRSCHAKMTFRIPEIKFLRVSTAASTNALPLRTRKPKENLGITSGTPLPNNGKCPHYSKSYRWFRFSCCNRVYPCDKCHDLGVAALGKDQAHPNEHAERMICGWCSREQRYHPDTCRMCGRSVIRKIVTTGFWEGGKGTREKGLMRRKEGHKYKTSGKERKEKAKKKVAREKGKMWWPE
ncbi:hypothetical protein H2198_008908 [Neophaeococcomyces mojaviensis]|uniref:Uncharacterized protein n=1 Tax=Neophaeococcomyces mojaviensis TaxID=3383035 RepID=A0ACC2ZW19_9EURO|nr:hypothetical protein H2198_008908 [Knufia sp. JES_112]